MSSHPLAAAPLAAAPPAGPWGGLALVAAAGVSAAAGLWIIWRLLNPYRGRVAPARAAPAAHPYGAQLVTPHRAARRPPRHAPRVPVFPHDLPLEWVPAEPGTGRTPYQVLGEDTVDAAARQLCSALRGDPALAGRFVGVDRDRLQKHQRAFLAQLLGGPIVYSRQDIAAVHHRLHLSPEEHWRVTVHLMMILCRLRAPEWINTFTVVRLYQIRDWIIHPARA